MYFRNHPPKWGCAHELWARNTEGGNPGAEKNMKNLLKKVVFTKFFSTTDMTKVMEAVAKKSASKILFVDTPSTSVLRDLVEELMGRGVQVVLRDHHGIINPGNSREQEIADANEAVRNLLGEAATIETRDEHPACSTLVEVGEFADFDLIVADPDADGLLGALKALGVTYPEMDSDAACLDGPRSAQTEENLSPVAVLLAKGLSTLPPFNPKRPEVAEEAKRTLFEEFCLAVQGDSEAMACLQARVVKYELAVEAARTILKGVTTVAPGVVLADAVGSAQFDLQTLSQGMEKGEGVSITVVRKDSGPIAAHHGGVQISLAVTREAKESVNLQDFLQEGFTSSPEAGVISNTTFLLHVSEKVWEEQVLPALRERFN